MPGSPPEPGAAGEDADDDQVRDREDPLDEREPAREPLRVLDRERRRIVRHLGERERRIAVGADRVRRVVVDAPRPAQHSDVEVEEAARVAASDEDRDPRHHRCHRGRHPEESEHDGVRDDEDPLDEPEPPVERLLQPALEPNGIDRRLERRRAAGRLR